MNFVCIELSAQRFCRYKTNQSCFWFVWDLIKKLTPAKLILLGGLYERCFFYKCCWYLLCIQDRSVRNFLEIIHCIRVVLKQKLKKKFLIFFCIFGIDLFCLWRPGNVPDGCKYFFFLKNFFFLLYSIHISEHFLGPHFCSSDVLTTLGVNFSLLVFSSILIQNAS